MRRYLVSLIIGSTLIMLGIMITIATVFEFQYINDVPTNAFKRDTIVVNDTFDNKDFNIDTRNASVTINETNEVIPGNIRVAISYYSNFISISKTLVQSELAGGSKTLTINMEGVSNRFSDLRGLYRLIIRELRNKKVYNYTYFFRPIIDIYVNSSDLGRLNVSNDIQHYEYKNLYYFGSSIN